MASESIYLGAVRAVVSECVVEVDYRATAGPTRVCVIPRGQEYYWSSAWRETERETIDSITRGDFVEFSSGRELAEWLFSDDDSAAPDTQARQL